MVTLCSACWDSLGSSCFPGVVTGNSGSLSDVPGFGAWLIGDPECGGGCICGAQESTVNSVLQRDLQTSELAGALALALEGKETGGGELKSGWGVTCRLRL